MTALESNKPGSTPGFVLEALKAKTIRIT